MGLPGFPISHRVRHGAGAQPATPGLGFGCCFADCTSGTSHVGPRAWCWTGCRSCFRHVGAAARPALFHVRRNRADSAWGRVNGNPVPIRWCGRGHLGSVGPAEAGRLPDGEPTDLPAGRVWHGHVLRHVRRSLCAELGRDHKGSAVGPARHAGIKRSGPAFNPGRNQPANSSFRLADHRSRSCRR